MARERDVRDFSASRMDGERTALLEYRAAEVSNRLPAAHRVRISAFDATTGNPATVTSDRAPAADGDVVRRALDHVTTIAPVLGLADAQAPEFVVDAAVQKTRAGATVVHLQQRYKGIPIFQAAQAVRFRPDGTLGDTVGNTVTVDEDTPVTVRLSASSAVRAAGEYLATTGEDAETDPFGAPVVSSTVDVSGYEPVVRAIVPSTPDQATVVAKGPFAADIPVSLVWFPTEERLRLGWSMTMTMPGNASQYAIIIDGDSGEVLFCQETVRTAVARGNVYVADGESRDMTEFAADWVDDDETRGNSVIAHLGETGPTTAGVRQGEAVVFDPPDARGDDQKVVNIFFFNAWAHDYFYALGFTEADGNFQIDNRGLGGLGGDAVDARSHPGPVDGTANMLTLPDGRAPIMNMGLVKATGRHTAFDRDVVLHEFTHGVTNRLVGGPLDQGSLTSMQARGMGEGWGDYIACTVGEKTVVGDWVVDDPKGIRGFPYDGAFPDGFGDLGQDRYTRVHAIGEIWCATLIEMNRIPDIGPELGVQLVVDALKLSPTNPSFLNMRDAILQAAADSQMAGELDDTRHAAVWAGIWRTFARFGMGVNARSHGAQLTGVVADHSVPADIDAETKA